MNKSKSHSYTFDPLTGMSLYAPNGLVCSAESGDGDEGGDPPEKTFTQSDIDRILKNRLKKLEKERDSLSSKLESQTKSFEDLSSKFDKLQEQYDASSKSDVEKELAKLQRQVAKMENEKSSALKAKEEAEALAQQAVAGLSQTKLRGMLRDSLRGAKAHGQGMDQAVELMINSGAKFDDEGNFGMTIDDVPYDKPTEAAAKWLEKNTHFLEGAGGGAGTPRAGGTKLLNNQAMESMSPAAMIAEGLKTR